MSTSLKVGYFVVFLSLTVSAVSALIWSMHWPIVGDTSLMHYVVFLLVNGHRPYSNIVDINLPGSYLFEAGAMKLFGWNALAWRVYDLSLVTVIGFSNLIIAKRKRLFAAVLATFMFLLLHVEDGLAQSGQRDLLVAALLMLAYASLFSAQEKPTRGWLILCSSLCIGLTLIIKPTFFPLGILLVLLSAKRMQQGGTSALRHFSYGLAGLVFPLLISLLWLIRLQSLHAFYQIATTLIPLHAELGRKSFSYLFAHSTAPLAPICGLWLIMLAVLRLRWTLERVELIAGIGMAFGAYIVQGKGFPYHRYPLLALLLLVMSLDFVDGFFQSAATRMIALTAVAFQCLVIAPHAAWLVRSFRTDTPFEQALSADLRTFGPELNGNVQCLDTYGGCINTLFDRRLIQSTGYLYDCYLFSPHQNNVTELYREKFWDAFKRTQPKLVILTDSFCFGDSGGFNKLDTWILLREEINKDYKQTLEWHPQERQRWWARAEYPPSFRIYVHN